MASKECSFETCVRTTLRGEKFCSEHNHIIALQTEMDRIKTLIPVDLRTLKSSIGPELENLLSALARLVVSGDPSRASSFGGGSQTARLDDKWTGQSMLDTLGTNVVTHRGAAGTAYSRETLMPRYKRKLQDLADDIIGDLNPELKDRHRKDTRPRCDNPKCRWRGQYQRIDAEVCGKCGESLFQNVGPSQ